MTPIFLSQERAAGETDICEKAANVAEEFQRTTEYGTGFEENPM